MLIIPEELAQDQISFSALIWCDRTAVKKKMEVFGTTGNICQKPTGSDVTDGDSAGVEMSSACDVRVGSSFLNENTTAPVSPKRMRLDTDRMEQPAADMPFYTNNSKTPLSEAEKEILLAQSSSLPHCILQESDTAKKQFGVKVEQAETAEFPEESTVHNQESDSHPLCYMNAKETESDAEREITKSPGLLQGVEHAVKSHLIAITFDNMDASAFEKCAVGTYPRSRYSSVAGASSVSPSDDFQQEYYGNADKEQGAEECYILTASHSVSDSSPSKPGRNSYGTLSGYGDAVGSQDRPSVFIEDVHASDRGTKAGVNEERIVCEEEMVDYASPGSIFTYDVSLSGDLGSNEPKISVSLALSVPGEAPLWLSSGTTEDAGALHKSNEYTAVVAHSGLSQMPASVYNDMSAVTEMEAGHEVNGADEESLNISEYRHPGVNSLTGDSTCVTVLPCASDVSLNDTTQCCSFPEACVKSPLVRGVVCEISDDRCAFVLPSYCDAENLNMEPIPRSLPEDDEQLVINDIGLDALLPASNGLPGEGPTTEDAVSINPHGSTAFGSFTKDAESFHTGAEAISDSYAAGTKTELLVQASLVSDSVDHHESRLEAAVCSSADRPMAMGVEVNFFDRSPSPSEMGLCLRLLSEGSEEKSKDLLRGAAEQQLVSLPEEEKAKATDAFAHNDTSHEYTVKDMPPFTLCSDAVVPLSHVSPAEDVTKERPVQPVFSECLPLGFDSFEKVQISPDSDLENSPLLHSLPLPVVAAAITHALTVPAPDNGPTTLAHTGTYSDEAIELILHHKDNCSAYSQDRCARLEGEENQRRSNSVSVASLQLSLSPFEPEESIHPSNSTTGPGVPLFGMKEMFDLVIEELRLYFEIDQEEEEEKSDELSAVSRRGTSALRSSPVSLAEQEEVESSDVHKVLECEQEVPLESGHPLPEEDSMYSTMNSKELRKNDNHMPWSPVFLSAPFLEHLERVEAPPKRLEPLKTCSRPIRVGLSKRARTKQLHPNLK